MQNISDLVAFIVENGLIPQLLLLVGVWGTILLLIVQNRDVPNFLQDAGLAILGYFFHVTQGAISDRGGAPGG